MCGITGFWEPSKNSNESESIAKKMLFTLHHRGPDGAAYHFDSTRNLVMGHTRLSIVDLSNTGNQPLYDDNQNLIFTANGEFYNYKTWRASLVAQGHSFHTKSDSEIALKLYRKYGLSFIDNLRGEFAFALFDNKAEQLILVRDRFGVRPLYYHISNQGIVYGSEIKSIFSHPHVKRAVSPKDALHQMMQVMVPGHTLFEGVRALRPGHMLIVQKTSSGIEYREKCYWDIDYPLQGQHDYTKTSSQHIEEVRAKLIEAIHIRLEADVPVGCYLSGGIDSCSIFGVASALQQSPVKAFTISFENKDFDEAMIAIEMATSLKADHEILTVKSEDLYGDNFKKALWHSERTFYNTLGISKMLMSQRVRERSYKVVLTGEGSDEIFGGYAFFKKDMFLHGKHSPELQQKLMESNRVFQGSLLSEQTVSHPAFEALCGFTPSWIQPWILTLETVKPLLSASFLEEISSYDPVEAVAKSFDPEKIRGRHPLDIAQYTWMKTMLEGQILNWGGDRVDMANSLETRPPFLDHELVELAAKIPPELRIHDGVEKWVLREAMCHILPYTLYTREKFSFMAPPAHTTRTVENNPLFALLNEYVSSEAIEDLGLLNQEVFTQFVESYTTEVEPAILTRQDIILNHIVGIHALQQLFTSQKTAVPV